jgi:hypothetical protein
MAIRKTKYEPPKRVKTIEGELQNIFELASIGLRPASIGRKLGYSTEDFNKLLSTRIDGQPIFQNAFLDGEAEFEEFNARIIDDGLHSDQVSESKKMQAARDNLKSKFEEWAPQVRSMKVVVEDKTTEFSFEDFTPEELAKIEQNSAAQDAQGEDGAEE